MEFVVKSLSKINLKSAVDIASAAEVGERKDIDREMKKSLDNKTKQFFVAVCLDNVVGEIGWYQDKEKTAKKALGKDFPEGEDVFWVAYFSVAPEIRGKGVGRLLVNKIESEVKNKGGKYLWVYSSRARVFYEKCGFTFIKKGYIEDCWQDFLRKDLQGQSL